MDDTQIIDRISNDMAIRKKELITLYLDCKESDLLRRCYLMMAYAHFEGFIKSTVNAVYTEIEKNNMTHRILHTIFTTLTVEKIFDKNKDEKKKKYSFMDIHNLLNRIPDEVCSFKKMESRNLYYNHLKTILDIFGLDDKKYELRKNWIDESFLKNRHKVAHGECFIPTYEYIKEIHEYLTNKLFDVFFYDIESYIKNKKYLKNLSFSEK